MKRNCLGFTMAVLALLLAGCCACNRSNWPESPALGYMDASQKLAYMDNVQRNLVTFRTTLGDIEQHNLNIPLEDQAACDEEQLPCEVYKYVEVYAMPIINDERALADLQTRFEVAKVNLLSAFALYETRHYRKANSLVRLFENRHGEDLSILNSSVDAGEMGFATLGEGLRVLKRKLALG